MSVLQLITVRLFSVCLSVPGLLRYPLAGLICTSSSPFWSKTCVGCCVGFSENSVCFDYFDFNVVCLVLLNFHPERHGKIFVICFTAAFQVICFAVNKRCVTAEAQRLPPGVLEVQNPFLLCRVVFFQHFPSPSSSAVAPSSVWQLLPLCPRWLQRAACWHLRES